MILFKRFKIIYTIRTKIILLAIFLTLIPLLIIGIFSYKYFSSVIHDKISNTTSNLLSIINWNIDTFINDVEDNSKIILSSKDIQNYLADNPQNTSERYNTESAAVDVLNNITNNKSYISAVFIGNEKMEYLKTKGGERSNNTYKDIMNTNWYKAVKANDGKGVWLKNSDVGFVKGRSTLLYAKILKNLSTLENIGILIISIDNRIFDKMFKDINASKSGNILITDGSEVLYYNANNKENALNKNDLGQIYELPGKGSLIKIINGEKYMLSFNSNDKTGWKIANIMPYNNVIKEIINVKNLTIILAFLSFALAMVGAFLISNKITIQLKFLKILIEKVIKREDISDIHFIQNDEIEKIGNETLKLLKENSELNTNLYTARLKEKEAELIALQSQINPHFLYNTLNSIFWMAEMIKAKNISKMVSCLSKMFKLSLNNGNHITTVRNEIEQIRNYIEILNIRYDNKFKTLIEIEESILDNQMLKLLIQPLVENAIYHGLELKEENGYLQITGRLSEKSMEFEICDNGVGFDSKEEGILGKGYALKNIDERIRLFYGSGYGLKLESTVNKGTKAIINIGLI